MGLKIFAIFLVSMVVAFVEGSNSDSNRYDAEILEDYIHDYAYQTLEEHHTGIMYNISLPSNFSGIEISVIRLRGSSFWVNGVNLSNFRIPPRILPLPYTKRLALVYQNLANWSSLYYNVPNYTLISPVIGFMGYDATNMSRVSESKLEFMVFGEPISIHFPPIFFEDKQVTPRCVRFGDDGDVEFENMSSKNVCSTKKWGNFCVVIPYYSSDNKKKKVMLWKWWVLGFGCGIIGLILVGLVLAIFVIMMKRKKVREMEKESEKGIAFETIWIGRSKMPSASTIRTQPALESEFP